MLVRSFSFLFLFLSIFSILRTNIYSYTQIWHLHVSWRPVEWILRCNFRSLKSHYTTRTCPVPTLQWIFPEKNFLLLIREFYLRKAEGYLKIIMISGSMPPQDVWFAFRIGGGIVVEYRYHTLKISNSTLSTKHQKTQMGKVDVAADQEKYKSKVAARKTKSFFSSFWQQWQYPNLEDR